MTAYPGQIPPVIEPGSVVMPLALRFSALDHCATWEPTREPGPLNSHSGARPPEQPLGSRLNLVEDPWNRESSGTQAE